MSVKLSIHKTEADDVYAPIISADSSTFIKFSAGELKHQLTLDYEKFEEAVQNSSKLAVVFDLEFESDQDLITLLMLDNAVSSLFKTYKGLIETKVLVSKYLPYSRQDRECNEGEAFGLKVVANLINSLNFTYVVTYDNHSEVANALINNCVNLELHEIDGTAEIVSKLTDDIAGDWYLVSPDAGAVKKSQKFYEAFEKGDFEGTFSGVITGLKIRDVATGKIKDTKVLVPDTDDKAYNCLIIDDICDGGATFTALAAKLREHTSGQVMLLTTHGIYSKGVDTLIDNGLNGVYCVNIMNKAEKAKYAKDTAE